MDQHQILTDLREHGYSGIDDRSKVRHLMEGISTATLDSVKNTILASTTLRSDFTACVGLYQDFITQSSIASTNETLLVAGLESEDNPGKRKRGAGGGGNSNGGRGGGGSGQGNGKGGGRGRRGHHPEKCEDRFYSREDYKKLTPGNHIYLRGLRDKRIESKSKRMRATPEDEAGFSRSLSVLASAVDHLQVQAAGVVVGAAAQDAATSNTNNPALQRIATRQGVRPPTE